MGTSQQRSQKGEDKMKVVGYVRVSTQMQFQDGVSLDAQENKIRAWADLNGCDKVEIFTDAGISGSSMEKREALLAALDAIGRGDVLVVYSLSRLARSTKDTLEIADLLIGKGADLVSLSEKIDTTTAAGKMVFRMLAVLNEFERDQIAERTKMALAYKKSQGRVYGQVPYGFRREGDCLCPDEAEEKVIGLILELRAQGWNYSKIARELNGLGYRSKCNGSYYPQTVKDILTQRRAA